MAAPNSIPSAAALLDIARAPNPLLWSYPSPVFLFQYPLFATNVKLLSEKDGWKTPSGQGGLVATISSLRLTYETEGLLGLYQGGHLYLLHHIARESLRCVASKCANWFEARLRKNAKQKQLEGGTDAAEERSTMHWLYWSKMAVKYAIDVACYPLLLASTRTVILTDTSVSTIERMRVWTRAEGVLSVFNGLSCSLAQTALDELMEIILACCIDQFGSATELELADKMLLKASAASVVSIFTAPFNYVGVIQRCQSSLAELVPYSSPFTIAWNLPWKASVYQFFLFAGIFALNVKMVQLKVEMQAEEDADLRNAPMFDDE